MNVRGRLLNQLRELSDHHQNGSANKDERQLEKGKTHRRKEEKAQKLNRCRVQHRPEGHRAMLIELFRIVAKALNGSLSTLTRCLSEDYRRNEEGGDERQDQAGTNHCYGIPEYLRDAINLLDQFRSAKTTAVSTVSKIGTIEERSEGGPTLLN